MTAGTDGQLLAMLRSVADSDNPAASQRCTNAGGVASVDKRSAQLWLYWLPIVVQRRQVTRLAHPPVRQQLWLTAELWITNVGIKLPSGRSATDSHDTKPSSEGFLLAKYWRIHMATIELKKLVSCLDW